MRCSVVFGVTLKLHVINISSSFLAINTTAYKFTTRGTLVVVHRRPCWPPPPPTPMHSREVDRQSRTGLILDICCQWLPTKARLARDIIKYALMLCRFHQLHYPSRFIESRIRFKLYTVLVTTSPRQHDCWLVVTSATPNLMILERLWVARSC